MLIKTKFKNTCVNAYSCFYLRKWVEEGGKMYGMRGREGGSSSELEGFGKSIDEMSQRYQKLLLLVIPSVEHTSNLDDNGDESER